MLGFDEEKSSESEGGASDKNSLASGSKEETKKDEEKEEENDEGPEFSEEEYLRKAESAYARGLYSIARDHLSKLREEYPGTPFESFAQLKTADTHFFARDFSAAIPIYEEFLKLHPGHEAAPYARLQVANAFREQYTGPAHDQSPVREAQSNYERVLQEYPGSYLVALAQEGLRYCRSAVEAHESYVADFYRRAGQEKATAMRLSLMKKDQAKKQKSLEAESARLSLNEATTNKAASNEGSPFAGRTSTTSPSEGALIEMASSGEESIVSPPSKPVDAPSKKPESIAKVSPLPPSEVPPEVPAETATPLATPAATPNPKALAVSAKSKTLPERLSPPPPQTRCRESGKYSVAEIPFDGEFEMRITQRQGARLNAELVFDSEEASRILELANSVEGPLSRCETKRFSLRVGLPQQREDELIRALRIQFSSGIQYRIFPLDGPKRLILVAFSKYD